jgi:type IV secretory pathway VirB6-like protein
MLRSQATSPPRHLVPTNPFKLLRPVVTNPLLPLVVFAGFAVSMAAYSFLFFSAILVGALLKGKAGLTNVAVAAAAGSMELKPVLLLAIPSAVAAIVAFLVAAHSQKRDEVYWHSSIPLLVSGVVFIIFPPLGAASVAAGFVAVIVFASSVAAANGPLLSVAAR